MIHTCHTLKCFCNFLLKIISYLTIGMTQQLHLNFSPVKFAVVKSVVLFVPSCIHLFILQISYTFVLSELLFIMDIQNALYYGAL